MHAVELFAGVGNVDERKMKEDEPPLTGRAADD
jgi:hypothetical protein